MNINRPRSAALAAGLLAISVTACGSVHAAQPASGSASPPRQAAEADAAANLAAVIVPSGARRVASVPASLASLAGQAPQTLGQIDDSGYWTVSGTALAELSGIRAHLPRSFVLTSSGSLGGLFMTPLHAGLHPAASTMPSQASSSATRFPTIPIMWYDGFTLPARAGLPVRAVFVSVASAIPGELLIRVDAQDSWPMTRTAADQITATVASVTISEISAGPIIAGNEVTVTAQDKIRRIVALVNGLSMQASGESFRCPVRTGAQYRLVFNGQSGTVATATLVPGACDVVGLRLGTGGSLILGGAHTFITKLGSITPLPAGYAGLPGTS